MRTALALILISIAFCLFGCLAVGWGQVILQQGLESALTDQTSQPPLLVTAGCLVAGALLLIVGLGLAFNRNGE